MAGVFAVAEETIAGTAHVVAVSGDLDAAASTVFKQRLLTALAHSEPLILDLSEVAYLDSPAVGALFAVHKETGMSRGGLTIVCQGEIRRLFEITGLDVAFEIVETRAEALERLGAIA